MGDFSRYEGKLPGRDTTTADLRQQQRTVQEETRRMIAALRRELTEKMSEGIADLSGKISELEERANDPTKGFDALDERVTALEQADSQEEAQEEETPEEEAAEEEEFPEEEVPEEEPEEELSDPEPAEETP